MAEYQKLPDDDELITDLHIAEESCTPQSRWKKARLTGDGPPFIKIGHLVRYRRGDWREWLASQPRVTSTSQLAA